MFFRPLARIMLDVNERIEMGYIKLAEEKLSSYINVKHSLLTSMGRTALVIGLKSLGVGPGDQVIMPSFACNIVVKAIEFCGAKPIFADVDLGTYNVDPKEIENKITKNTKAVLVIHCYGQPADMTEITEIAESNDVPIIEDAAHAFGADYHGRKVGSFGQFCIFSFSKNMGCSSGGGLSTNSDDLILRATEVLKDLYASENELIRVGHSVKQMLLAFGSKKRAWLSSLRMLGIATKVADSAADSIPKLFSADDKIASEVIRGLREVDGKNEDRIRRARVLTELIKDLKIDDVKVPLEREDRTHVYYLYGLKVNERKKILGSLRRIEKYIPWSLPWLCSYGPKAKHLAEHLVLFEMNSPLDDERLHLIASALAHAS